MYLMFLLHFILDLKKKKDSVDQRRECLQEPAYSNRPQIYM